MRLEALFLGLVLAALPARADDSAAAAGRRIAAASPLDWTLAEGAHPRMGPIRFAALRTPIFTAVGRERISSRIFFSCERNTDTIAIELANSLRPDDTTGLRPKSTPRLICHRVSPGDGKLTPEGVPVRWTVSHVGDPLVRGLRPAFLRQCASLGIRQEVLLPSGWEQPSARIEIEITPYAEALDSVLYTCGGGSMAGVAAASRDAPIAPPPAIAPSPPVPAPAPAEAAWVPARTHASGRTNLRARATTTAKVVAQLPPNVRVLVQAVGNDWWKVKAPPGGARFEGYIRSDRLVFR